MKPLIPILLLVSSPLYAGSVRQDTFTNEITQVNTWTDEANNSRRIQFTLSEMTGVAVDTHGKDQTMESIMGRSVFELSATNDRSNLTTILDTKTVDSYLADATEFKIHGPAVDPYNATHPDSQRTQVGQGFTISLKVKGLQPEGSQDSKGNPLPEAATSLLLERALYPFASKYSPPAESLPVTVIQQSISDNGNIESFVFSELTAGDLTKVRGEERITIYLKADPANGHVDDSALTREETIKVWPISSGRISLPSPDKTIDNTPLYEEFPKATLKLKDLYPGSSTYLKVLVNGEVLFAEYKPFINKKDFPENKNLTRNGDGIFNEILRSYPNSSIITSPDTSYSLQLWHKTPFATVMLGETPTFKFLAPDTIKVNASINSIE